MFWIDICEWYFTKWKMRIWGHLRSIFGKQTSKHATVWGVGTSIFCEFLPPQILLIGPENTQYPHRRWIKRMNSASDFSSSGSGLVLVLRRGFGWSISNSRGSQILFWHPKRVFSRSVLGFIQSQRLETFFSEPKFAKNSLEMTKSSRNAHFWDIFWVIPWRFRHF